MNDGRRKRTDIGEDDERQNPINNKIVEEGTIFGKKDSLAVEPPNVDNTASVSSTSTSSDVISESEAIVSEDHHNQKKKSYKQKFRSEWLKDFFVARA
ncbi:hypothetical protein FQA39_LY12766 [Lamprigera yunnana]|nr:hypothetical protein FQA39_LY12766 [Lamprigera yunnana]